MAPDRKLLAAALFCSGFASLAAAQPVTLPGWNVFSMVAGERPANNGSSVASPQIQASTLSTPQPEPGTDDLILRNMIGQMILIGFPGNVHDHSWQRRVVQMVHDGKIGGVVLFSENIVNPRQVRQFNTTLSRRGSPEPLVCVDQEGGAIQRLTAGKGFVGLPGAQQVGSMSPAQAWNLYRKSAEEMARLGINCNFGPVVDLDVNPDSPAIGRLGRAYGRDPQKVMAYARSFIDAHRLAGVLTAAKHFPGHGSARNDPHEQVVDISRTWRDAELESFKGIIERDPTDMIMVGHLVHPLFSDGNRPASLSRAAITEILREQLEYRGLIVSDDLDMGAIRKRYGIEEAAVMAIEAGNDMVIIANTKTPDILIADRIIGAVSRAIAAGRIKPEAIRQSYDRILAIKARLAERRAYVLQSAVPLQ